MRFEGFLVVPRGKSNPFWHVEVPSLSLCTQGKSRRDALRMIKDAIELGVGQRGFRIEVFVQKGNVFTVGANDTRTLLAFMLRQQRASHGLTLQQVAARLKINSVNAYARYEQGKTAPTVEKLIELLHAIDPHYDPILKIA